MNRNDAHAAHVTLGGVAVEAQRAEGAAVMKNTRTIEVCVYTRKIDDSEMPISAENTQNSIWAVAGRSRLMPAEIANTMAERREDEQPLQRADIHRVAERRQERVAELGGGAGLVGGHGSHIDAERREAGDGQADAHVVVDAQHVGAQTGIDGRGINAPGGPAERRSIVTV
jgi:hypothetical protein